MSCGGSMRRICRKSGHWNEPASSLMDVSVTLARRFEEPHVAGIHEPIVVRPASAGRPGCRHRDLAGDPWGRRYENDPEYEL